MESGWIWDIGLLERSEVGHVYSSKYTSHEEAEKVLRDFVGSLADKYPTRLIEKSIGYREKSGHKNCAAIDLAQGFIDPLEATGLLVFDATAKMLAAHSLLIKKLWRLLLSNSTNALSSVGKA